jgi:UDP-N-acetylglucosamine 2-epimerase (non-hydrolysing)
MMKKASILLTDSGGLQEEGPGLGVPVLVMRKVTERPEGIEAGVVKLVGVEEDTIVNEVQDILDNPDEYRRMIKAVNPYGDGKAAGRIVNALIMKDN